MPLAICLILLATVPPRIDWQAEQPAPGPRGAVVLAGGAILMPGRADDSGARLACFVSKDEGKSWTRQGIIATDPERRTDIGDGNIVLGPEGILYAVYRHNHHGPSNATPDYAVEVSVSSDGGVTWKADSTVAASRPKGSGPSRGLWSPFLFLSSTGILQCYYDDEDTPFRRGFPGHQWVTMKTYSPRRRKWERPVTVARSHDPKLLSRDGMASVIETGKGKLLCAFESVQTDAPHAGLIRMVTSNDDGRTWSWKVGERKALYQPRDHRYHAFAPALLRLPDDGVLAFFATNEDRAEPGISGTPAQDLSLDIKYVSSSDEGQTWNSPALLLYSGTHRNYLPGIVRLPGPDVRLMATFLDFDRGCLGKVGLNVRD